MNRSVDADTNAMKHPITTSIPNEANATKNTTMGSNNIIPRKKVITFQQAVLSNMSTPSTTHTSQKSTLTVLSKRHSDSISDSTTKCANPPKDIVKFADNPSNTVTCTKVPTSEMIYKPVTNHNMITRLSSTQINDITYAVSLKYDSVIQKMQKEHEKQIKHIIGTQKAQDDEINAIKQSQKTLRTDLQEQLQTKMDTQTTLLHSMVTMIQDIKNAKIDNVPEKVSQVSHISSAAVSSVASKLTQPTVIQHSQDPDISYSDTESDDDDIGGNDEAMTATTILSTVDSPQEDPIIHDTNTTPIKQSNLSSLHSDQDSDKHKCDAKCSPRCEHVNNIEADSKDDIRQVTRTMSVEPSSVVQEGGWNDVNGSSKKKVPLRHAIISPPKRYTRSMYKKGSPSYNHYDPTGVIHRKSQRLKNKQDHSDHPKKKMTKSDRDP
jgi:hypothetical protein